MEEVTGAVGGFRAAIQDLLVPELKALQVEIRNVKETLERHEKWLGRHDQTLSQLADAIRQLGKEQAERFAAMQKENNDRFDAVTNAIRGLQESVSTVTMQMNFIEKFHQLELQIARMNRAGSPATF
jgi:septal ring factor EnvC (AmiA/AmiB activator)